MPTPKLYQIIPNDVCLSCDVCCRFLEADSQLAPIFTEKEKQQAISHGADPTLFQLQSDGKSSQIKLKPYKHYYLCPFFDPKTNECTIYTYRPLDCQLYPFALMYNQDKTKVVLGVDMLCPFSETQYETTTFQQHLQLVINYIETEEISDMIAQTWSLIGEYQDTVKIFHTLNHNLQNATASPNP